MLQHTDYDLEQEQMIGYWVRKHGLKHKDLSRHPHIDDCILLIKIRDSAWHKFNKSEQATWGAIWNQVYHKQRALKKKHLTSLEQAVINSHQRHLENLVKQAQQRQRIQARRNLCQTQGDDDMMAKASPADTSVPWEV